MAGQLRDRPRADAVIGVLWAVGMALGVILIDLTPGYNVDLMSYLFGSILAVAPAGPLPPGRTGRGHPGPDRLELPPSRGDVL